MPKQKWTGQNRIRLVKYSSSEVSDPSEVVDVDVRCPVLVPLLPCPPERVLVGSR